VSPDAGLARTLSRLVFRARLAAAVEAAAVGAAAAAWSVPAGLVLAIVVAVVRARTTARPAVVRRLERANPTLNNLVVTAEEMLSGALPARPVIRQRVVDEATAAASDARTAPMWPVGRIAALFVIAVAVWAVRAAYATRTRTDVQSNRSTIPTEATGPSTGLQVAVRIDPPAYTGLPPTSVVNPASLQAIENSRLGFSIASGATSVDVDVNGRKTTATRAADGSFVDRAVAASSGYIVVTAQDGGRRVIPMTVSPDALPTVRVVSPGKDLVFARGNPRLRFEVDGTDDYGLRSMSLKFTKVSGSGEQFEFKEGEIPLSIERSRATAWKANASPTLEEFGLNEGDMLVYRGVATDGRPDGAEATSDSYFIEISRLGGAAADAFTLPEEETRYALSQQMLIVKTERLIKQRGSRAPADFAEYARELAIEQRMIRSELVFMLGGEIEDEDFEAEQSTELQEGRLANRGQRDLRAATVAMSQAEKQLTDANPEKALDAERAAVNALQRAFARDRYILRALATSNPLDEKRRLTGVAPDAIGWKRQLLSREEGSGALRLADLLQGIGDLAVDSVNLADARRRLSVLAELSLRIDPQSAALRQAATNLQQLADSWAGLDAGERRRRLDAVAADVAGEARRALADPPTPIGGRR
jgi:hypothetical protein